MVFDMVKPLIIQLLFVYAAATPLQYRDVNILAVTDSHAWIAGGDKQVKSQISGYTNNTVCACVCVSFTDHDPHTPQDLSC